MNSEIIFRVATESDIDKITEFQRKNFFFEEPINKAYQSTTKDISMENKFVLSLVPDGNVIFGIDSFNDRIAGIVSFGEITRNYSKESWEESETTTDPTWRDILKFMSYIEAKSNCCERLKVPASLHIHSVAIDHDYRGRSLGKKLFEKVFEVARDRKYQLVDAECTSVYSSRIAESLGMELIATTTYKEYNEKIGKKMFIPTPPNTDIRSFVKRIL